MERLKRSSLAAIALVALMAAPAAAAASMSPGYVSSDPEHEEMLDEAPERVEVTFDEPLDMSSEITVKDECGRTVDDGEVQVRGNMMSVGIALTPDGHYYVTYAAKGVGNLTGTESAGFNFMVHNGDPCGPGAHGGKKHGGGDDGGGSGHDGSGGSHQGSGDGGHPGSGHTNDGNDYSSGNHNSMGHSRSSRQHDAMSGGANHDGTSQKHAGMKHGKGNYRKGKHGGKHDVAGAHGLLDILEKNKKKAEAAEQAALAAGPGVPISPDGQAVLLALALSLVLGALGGWFLRVSGQR